MKASVATTEASASQRSATCRPHLSAKLEIKSKQILSGDYNIFGDNIPMVSVKEKLWLFNDNVNVDVDKLVFSYFRRRYRFTPITGCICGV